MTIQLDQSAIYAKLNPAVEQYLSNDKPIEVFQQLDSTQRYLKEKLKESSCVNNDDFAAVGGAALVAAESQSSGKGRMDRDWHATAESNILFSCSWVYDEIPKDLAGLSLALIVSLAEYLKSAFDLPVSIKWPNDLLLSAQKVAGLLVDVETGQKCRVVVGLGLNVSQSFENDVIERSWTDLSQHGLNDLDRNAMIAAIFSDWVGVFVSYPALGFTEFQERWNKLSEHKGKEVILHKSGQVSAENIEGVMEGVDRNGFLLIRCKDGVRQISDSSYSLKVSAEL